MACEEEAAACVAATANRLVKEAELVAAYANELVVCAAYYSCLMGSGDVPNPADPLKGAGSPAHEVTRIRKQIADCADALSELVTDG